MSARPDPRDRRHRRSLTGRAVVRLRPTPTMLRATPPTSPLARLLALLLLGVSATMLLVGLGGVTVAYGAYRDLADSLTPRLERLDSGGEEGDSGNCGSNVRAGVSHREATQMFQEATESSSTLAVAIAGSLCAWHCTPLPDAARTLRA